MHTGAVLYHSTTLQSIMVIMIQAEAELRMNGDFAEPGSDLITKNQIDRQICMAYMIKRILVVWV
jgi:hypothetical protein